MKLYMFVTNLLKNCYYKSQEKHCFYAIKCFNSINIVAIVCREVAWINISDALALSFHCNKKSKH